MIAAIGEGKTLGGTAHHDGRVGRPYVNEVVLLRANPGASQAKPPFGWPISPTLAGTTGAGSGGCRPASNMQATIASLAMRTMGVERPAADFRAKLPASSYLRSSLRVTGAETVRIWIFQSAIVCYAVSDCGPVQTDSCLRVG
jgi:hypothetical protein